MTYPYYPPKHQPNYHRKICSGQNVVFENKNIFGRGRGSTTFVTNLQYMSFLMIPSFLLLFAVKIQSLHSTLNINMCSNTRCGESDEDGDDGARFVHTENLMTPSSKAETRWQPIVIRHESRV